MRCLRGHLRPARTPLPAALLCTHRCISGGNDVLCQRKCAEYSPTVLPSALVRAEQSGRYRPAVEDNTGTGHHPPTVFPDHAARPPSCAQPSGLSTVHP